MKTINKFLLTDLLDELHITYAVKKASAYIFEGSVCLYRSNWNLSDPFFLCEVEFNPFRIFYFADGSKLRLCKHMQMYTLTFAIDFYY